MTATLKAMLAAAALLGGCALLGIGWVALVHGATARQIAENRRETLRQSLQAVLPPGQYDNDLLADAIEVASPELGPLPVMAYRARKQSLPVAAVLAPVAPDGYGGDIRLLVAVKVDGSLAGARALAHKETPGLGDLIDGRKSRWIFGFDGLSLGNPPERLWRVKRDGGAFDQFAGATVTPRAVVKAVRGVLAFFRSHQAALFAAPAQTLVEGQ